MKHSNYKEHIYMRAEVNSNRFEISFWGKVSRRCILLKLLHLVLSFHLFNFSKMKDTNIQMKEIRITGIIPFHQ